MVILNLVILFLAVSCGKGQPAAKVPVSDKETKVVVPATQASPVPSSPQPNNGLQYSFPLSDDDALRVMASHCVRCHSDYKNLDSAKRNSKVSAKAIAESKMPQYNTSWAKSELGLELKSWFEKNSK